MHQHLSNDKEWSSITMRKNDLPSSLEQIYSSIDPSIQSHLDVPILRSPALPWSSPNIASTSLTILLDMSHKLDWTSILLVTRSNLSFGTCRGESWGRWRLWWWPGQRWILNWKSSIRYLGVKASIIVVIVLGKLIVSSRTLWLT